MAPGFGLGIIPPSGGGVAADVAALVTDYFWELASAGNLQPLAKGTVSDFNDMWDIDGDDNYMPAAAGSKLIEGYFDLNSDFDVQPLDV